MKKNYERQYFDTLKRIARYSSPEHLRDHSEEEYGLLFDEALEMAYENVIEEARTAIKGRRRPKS
jgi:hypothetical protein